VLVYEATAEDTCARIYSAAHSDERFQPSRELIRRRISSEDIYLHGNYQLRRSGDIAIVGDYVGLAGAGDTLAAAVVMPEDDDWRSENAAYAGIFTEPNGS
jgi:hypothetical protein